MRVVFLALALLALPFEVGATVILDEFNGPAGGQSLSAANVGDVFDTASGTGAVGDLRRLSMGGLGSPNPGSFALAEINTGAAPGKFHLSASNDLPGAGVHINYEGPGFDLDLSGQNAIVFEGVIVSSFTDFTVSLDAPAEEGGFVSSGYGIFLQAGFSGDVSFDLSRFEGDLSHVDRIQVDVGVNSPPSPSYDVLIDRLVAVPEPATSVLMGAGLAAAALRPTRPRTRPHTNSGT